jgi:hypothetical protein
LFLLRQGTSISALRQGTSISALRQGTSISALRQGTSISALRQGTSISALLITRTRLQIKQLVDKKLALKLTYWRKVRLSQQK